jgi:hypothetical protein
MTQRILKSRSHFLGPVRHVKPEPCVMSKSIQNKFPLAALLTGLCVSFVMSACGLNPSASRVPVVSDFISASIGDVYPIAKILPKVKAINPLRHNTAASLAVGLVVIAVEEQIEEQKKVGVGQCTGFLIAPDIAATNSHCIPQLLKQNPGDCRNRLAIVFPAGGDRKAETRLCQKLIAASEIVKNPHHPEFTRRADYAYFQLDTASERQPIPINSEGLGDNDALTAYAFDPKPSNQAPIGVLRKKECVVRKGTFFYPNPSRWAPVSVASGDKCRVIPGNSGSPAINAAGDAVGIIHAAGVQDKLQESAKASDIKLPEHIEPFTVLTNFACVKTFTNTIGGVIWGTHPRCGTAETFSKQNYTPGMYLAERINQSTDEELRKMFQAWRATAPDQFIYRARPSMIEVPTASEFDPSEYAKFLLVQPICIRPEEGRGSATPTGALKAGAANDKQLNIVYPIPAFESQRVYDRYLRPGIELRPTASFTVRLSIDPNLVGPEEQPVGTLTILTTAGQVTRAGRLAQPLHLHTCSSADILRGDVLMWNLEAQQAP